MIQKHFLLTEEPEAIQWILKQVQPYLKSDTLIDAGHFLLKVDQKTGQVINQPDILTTLGWKAALALKNTAPAAVPTTLSFLVGDFAYSSACLLYTSPSPRD